MNPCHLHPETPGAPPQLALISHTERSPLSRLSQFSPPGGDEGYQVPVTAAHCLLNIIIHRLFTLLSPNETRVSLYAAFLWEGEGGGSAAFTAAHKAKSCWQTAGSTRRWTMKVGTIHESLPGKFPSCDVISLILWK